VTSARGRDVGDRMNMQQRPRDMPGKFKDRNRIGDSPSATGMPKLNVASTFPLGTVPTRGVVLPVRSAHGEPP
jgi:hypothetical protein